MEQVDDHDGGVCRSRQRGVRPTRKEFYAAWDENRLGDLGAWFSKSSDGIHWSQPHRLNDDSTGNKRGQYFPELALAPSGRVVVDWYDFRNDQSPVPTQSTGSTAAPSRVTQVWGPRARAGLSVLRNDSVRSGVAWSFRACIGVTGRTIRHALRAAIVAAIASAGVTVAAAIDYSVLFPLLFTSLGPTAYQLAYQPRHQTSRVLRAGTAHVVAVGSGLLALWVFGVWTSPGIVAVGHATIPRIGAAGMAVGLTLLLLELIGAHHAPAGSTALVVALGIALPWRQTLGLIAGLALVIMVTTLLTTGLRRFYAAPSTLANEGDGEQRERPRASGGRLAQRK